MNNEDYEELEPDSQEEIKIQIIPPNNPDFKFEYAFESITMKNSHYREVSNNID